MAKRLKMSLLTDQVPNPFRSVGDMCKELDIKQSSYAQGWRLTEYELGQIIGLPMSRGRICAADGISCVIITESGFYIGHEAWFVVEKQPSERKISVKFLDEPVLPSKKKLAILSEINNLLSI